MFSKRSQVTLFLLIGIVILIGVGFVLRATSIQTKAKLDASTEGLTSELLKTTAFENYVNKCLKKLTKDAIIYVGEQGGKIDVSQGGVDDWLGDFFIPGKDAIPFEKDNQSFYVFYGLKKQVLFENPGRGQIPAAPIYPYPGSLLSGIDLKESSYGSKVSIYGVNQLLPLCDINGPNNRGGLVKNTCKSYGPSSFSVQKQIQDYIAKNLPLCVDFDSFAKTFAYNISRGNVSVNVTITDEFVSSVAVYPLEIRLSGGSRTVKVLNFRDDVKVRLKRIHEFANAFIDSEAKRLLWNYSNYKDVRDASGVLWDGDLKFYVTNDACSGCSSDFGGKYDDIVSVVDYASVIDGVPYEFKFGVENRVPALDEVKEFNFDPLHYDFVVLEGATLIMTPIAFDPDEDKLVFNYSGWKADYDEVYSFLGSDVVGVENTPYLDPSTENKWMNSEEYLSTEVNASYNTSISDIGPHNFTIAVLDDEGLYDFQKVRVLVNDMPIAVAKGDNFYSDIPDNYASLEDPFEVDAVGSRDIFSGPGGITYVFVDSKEALRRERATSSFMVPTNPNPHVLGDGFKVLGSHDFQVFVVDNIPYATGTSMVSLPLNVYPCLPHRNSNNPYPFPYQNYKPGGASQYVSGDSFYLDSSNPINMFMSDHSCCAGNIGDPSTWRLINRSENVVCSPPTQPTLYCNGRGDYCYSH